MKPGHGIMGLNGLFRPTRERSRASHFPDSPASVCLAVALWAAAFFLAGRVRGAPILEGRGANSTAKAQEGAVRAEGLPKGADEEPMTATECMELAAAAYADGKLELAAELYQKACDADPENAEACYRLAAVHETLGNLPGAIEAYESLMRVGKGGRWADLAAARLGPLRSRAAIDRLVLAERLAQAQAYGEAIKALREADRFSPPPAVHRTIRQRYYQYAADDLARRLAAEMKRARLVSLATGTFLGAPPEEGQNASYFTDIFRTSLGHPVGLVVTSAELPAAIVRRLVDIPEGRFADVELPTEGVPPQSDCLLVGVWAQSLCVAVVNLRNDEVILSRKLEPLGPVPPLPVSEVWHRLPARPDTNREMWAWVWGEAEELPPDAATIRLSVQVNQSSYVVLMQLASDGSLEMLLPSEGRRDNFLRERQLYTFDCRAGKPGEEAGVWMIASRTPLVMGADIEGRAEASDILKRIVAGLPALPRQSWATSAWTWRVKPVAPPAVPPGPGEAEEEHRAPLE